MRKIEYRRVAIDTKPFGDLVGEDVIKFVFTHAPAKVAVRIARALDHYTRAPILAGLDEEMGAIRLIAAEEELVVAIFEWLKINNDKFPEHMDFTRKFKNHVVKLSFYPALSQFRFIIVDMLHHGFTFDGFEDVINWSVEPVIDGSNIKLAVLDNNGKELIRHNPLSTFISQGDLHGKDVVPLLLVEFENLITDQRGTTMREFLLERADFRNKLLYASDAGSVAMEDRLPELIEAFKRTYQDLLWVLAILIGGEPPSKQWGMVSQFIAFYREALIRAGVLRADNTVEETPD
jgi:hypothetical protein